MGLPAQTATLIGKELKVLARDRQAVVLLFLMPAVFILFLSFALESVFTEKVGGTVPVVLESEDGGAPAACVLAELRSRAEFRIVPRGGAADDRALFASATAKAVILIPRGFSEDLDAFVARRGRGAFGPHRIVWDADPTLDATYRWFLKASIAMAVQGAMLDRIAQPQQEGREKGRTAGEENEPASGGFGAERVQDHQREAAAAAGNSPGSRDGTRARDANSFLMEAPNGPEARVVPTPLQQTVPGWSLFAMFFIVVPLAGSFIRDRQEGTLLRLATYPISRGAIVLGKLLPYLLVNVVQFALMLAVGLYVVPALGELSLQLGARPWNLVPVTLAAALAATGFGILVASVSRTIEQASALGSSAIIIMAVAGGIMVPIFLMPAFMQKIARASPLYWGQQAYLDVLLREAPFDVIAPKLAVLLAFASLCFLLASWRLRRPG